MTNHMWNGIQHQFGRVRGREMLVHITLNMALPTPPHRVHKNAIVILIHRWRVPRNKRRTKCSNRMPYTRRILAKTEGEGARERVRERERRKINLLKLFWHMLNGVMREPGCARHSNGTEWMTEYEYANALTRTHQQPHHSWLGICVWCDFENENK